MHHDGELIGYVANLAHHVDVGGGAPASIGAFREVFQEGVIIPPVKLVEAGEVVHDVFALILAQIRSKHETGGDLRAQIAANIPASAASRRWPSGTAATRCSPRWTSCSPTPSAARAPSRGAPARHYEAEGFVDNDGFTDEPVRLAVRVELEPTACASTSTGSDPQRRAPVNSTYAQTFSACAYAVKCLIDPDTPSERRLLPADPARRAERHRHQLHLAEPGRRRLGDADAARRRDLQRALPSMPERLPAGTKAMMCHAGFGGVDPASGDYYCFLETFAGGYGGRAASDGPDAVQTHGQNTENAPVEETELNYPVRVARLSLVDDSEGPGRLPRRARAAQGLRLRPADARSPCSPTGR